MGRKHPAPVGAYVDLDMLNYIDGLVNSRGFSCRSDAVRSIISEHQRLFSTKTGGNTVLTPFENPMNGNGQTHLSKRLESGDDERRKKIIQDVDMLLTDLSEEFDVPKPNYNIYKLTEIKKLDKWKFSNSLVITAQGMRPPMNYGAYFINKNRGKLCYISLLLKNNRNVSKKSIVHEFFHYKHFVECDYDWGNNVDWSVEKEEKLTKYETKNYMKHLKECENLVSSQDFFE